MSNVAAIPKAPPTDPFNLDELEELNPQPQVYTLGGKELILVELPHHEMVRAQHRMAQVQDAVRRAELTDEVIDGLDRDMRGLLYDLFKGSNAWLTEADASAYVKASQEWEEAEGSKGPQPVRAAYVGSFFNAFSDRKLAYLLERAFEYLQAFAIAESERAKEAGAADPFRERLTNPSPGEASTNS